MSIRTRGPHCIDMIVFCASQGDFSVRFVALTNRDKFFTFKADMFYRFPFPVHLMHMKCLCFQVSKNFFLASSLHALHITMILLTEMVHMKDFCKSVWHSAIYFHQCIKDSWIAPRTTRNLHQFTEFFIVLYETYLFLTISVTLMKFCKP